MTRWSAFLAVSAVLLSQTPHSYFVISVVDEATGRGVPLVELKTVDDVTWYADSNGLVAFHEPGMMGRRVFFFIKADGYEYPKDGLGYRGRAFEVKAGGSAVVKLKRTEIAERLYRLTGEGMYRDTVMAGRQPPIERPLVNGGVSGMDGPQTTVYRGKVYWFFGDTSAIDYPLGNFASTGGTSELPQHGGLNPSVGVNLHYFVRPDGFVKPMLDIPGEGPKWMGGLMVLTDRSGRERLLTQYRRVQQDMAAKEIGLAVFDDDAQAFHKLVEFPLNAKTVPDGRPFLVRSGGEDYYQFGLLTLPWVRVKADWDAVQHLENYEVYTCYKPGAGAELERDAEGKLVCGWKRNADPMGWDEQKSLAASGKLKAQEGMWQVHDVDGGQQVEVRNGSAFWNEYRKRWIAIFERNGWGRETGSSIYFAEADTPVGPWVYAKKVAGFEHYTFYWPGQLPYFDKKGGRTIYFAGTYSDSFSSAPFPTPRYNYNVIMYRLALDDPRLALPAPIYRMTGTNSRYLMREGMEAEGAWGKQESIPFFAVPPQAVNTGLIPIFAVQSNNRTTLSAKASAGSAALFYALPATAPPQIPQGPGGKWSCTAQTGDGADFTNFPLDLSLTGETVRVMSGDGGSGSFKGGELRLRLKTGDESYDLSGALKDGELTGIWRGRQGDKERGRWSCKRSVEAEPAVSPAVLPLFEYTRAADGSHVYSTDPDLRQPGLNRSAEPVCRVWRTPMSQMILDAQEKPVIVNR
jgi:hypothetical protein